MIEARCCWLSTIVQVQARVGNWHIHLSDMTFSLKHPDVERSVSAASNGICFVVLVLAAYRSVVHFERAMKSRKHQELAPPS